MQDPSYFTTPQGRRIAYHLTAGQGPGVVFLGGFKSNMQGTKALYLQDWAMTQGRAFLRFDYSGHGSSSGDFLDGSIGDWFEDAQAVIEGLTTGPQVLVGSSMGGWIALLLAREIPQRLSGLVGIAAAPDFTEEIRADLDDSQRADMQTNGRVAMPSDYADSPYIITRHLLDEGRNRLVLSAPLPLPFPVRLLQGTADTDVLPATALRLLDHVSGPDISLTLVKGADHRFSTESCLGMIAAVITDCVDRAEDV